MIIGTSSHFMEPIGMNKPSFSDKLSTNLLKVLPQHLLSNLMHWAARNEWKPFKTLFIKQISTRYGVNMNEAANPDLSSYSSFNAFFTRELKAGVRPINNDANSIVSPVDGQISQIGKIEKDQLLQAKGHNFSLVDLLAGDTKLSAQFENGHFTTVYLSPKDYHRIHMPVTGKLKQMTFVPGDLFSVSEATTQLVPNLFARNERTITVFETENGPMVLILVGAIFVGSMETIWHGEILSNGKKPTTWTYSDDQQITLNKGEEMGRFNMGSTIILLHPKNAIEWIAEAKAGDLVKLGEKIGVFK